MSTQDQAGYFNAIIIGCGLVGAGVAGVFVDKTKRFTEVSDFMQRAFARRGWCRVGRVGIHDTTAGFQHPEVDLFVSLLLVLLACCPC